MIKYHPQFRPVCRDTQQPWFTLYTITNNGKEVQKIVGIQMRGSRIVKNVSIKTAELMLKIFGTGGTQQG